MFYLNLPQPLRFWATCINKITTYSWESHNRPGWFWDFWKNKDLKCFTRVDLPHVPTKKNETVHGERCALGQLSSLLASQPTPKLTIRPGATGIFPIQAWHRRGGERLPRNGESHIHLLSFTTGNNTSIYSSDCSLLGFSHPLVSCQGKIHVFFCIIPVGHERISKQLLQGQLLVPRKHLLLRQDIWEVGRKSRPTRPLFLNCIQNDFFIFN